MLKRVTWAAALLALALAISACDHRAPESALVGTWQRSQGGDAATFVRFGADHVVLGFSDGIGGEMVDFRGTWFAGGTQIFLRYDGRTHVWKIIDILPDEFQVHESSPDISLYRRVTRMPPQASNQAMQRTAGRTAFSLSMTSTFNLQRHALSPAVADLVSR